MDDDRVPPAADTHVRGADDVVQLDFPECEIWMRASSSMERNWRAHSCAKEPWTADWLRNAVKPGDVLYDIGANVGTFSLVAARHCQARVIAFEPGYSSFSRLCDNIQLNGCQHMIVPVPIPLTDHNGVFGFKYRSVDPGQSRHRLKPEAWRFRGLTPAAARYEQPMLAMTLDDVVSTFRLPEPHHLKIDVDGAEERVLAGARRTLKSSALRSVLIEADNTKWSAIVKQLETAGLALDRRIARDTKKSEAPAYGLFIRPSRTKRDHLFAWWPRPRTAGVS
jgi:FkbM family methyltransferase